MNQLQTINIKEYLLNKGIPFKEGNGELITDCFFCDKKDHLYFSIETGQYDCKVCGEQGNIITLAKHLGDSIKDISLDNPQKLKLSKPKFNTDLIEICHQKLPDRIRQYLNQRGITDEIISEFKLGFGQFYNKFWITIPVKDKGGDFVFLKLRKDPADKTNPDKYKFYPQGSSSTIFGWEMINEDMVVICEGEFDQLLLRGHAIPAITSTAGASTFKKEWTEHLKNTKKVYVCFDKDEAGEKGAKRLTKILAEKIEGLRIFKISLPEEVGKGGDLTDYLIKHNGNIDDLFYKHAAEILNFDETERIKEVTQPAREINYEEWRETIKGNFPELVFPAKLGVSIMAQILIKEITNPFALVLVDVPSSGKTICINFFSEIEGLTYATDKFTPASFVSNAANVKKEKLKEIDLLPRLKYKMFLIRDLSTLFSKREEDLNECLGILTRVLDGEGLNTDSGVHGQRQYTGEYLFMILAASTPISPRVWKMMGNLGSRLFFLNMNIKEKSEDELANQITTLAYKQKESACRLATKNFILTLWHKYQAGIDWDKAQDKQEDKIIIARCARLLAKLRGVINVWKETREEGGEYSYYSPVIEKPDRINQLFYNLCRGHALVCGRTQINRDDLQLIVELAIDSCPTIRARLFRGLLENNGKMETSEIEATLQCSKPTALKEMEMLKILGVCYITQDSDGTAGEPEKTLHLTKDFQWFLSDECKTIRRIPSPPKQDTLADLF